MRETKVTIFKDLGADVYDEWYFGSLNGAKEFVAEQVAKGGVKAYSISVIDWMPCDPADPDGKLYGGMIYHDYQKV